MKRKNEWEKLAVQEPTIQKTKNDVLNKGVISLVKEYAKCGVKVFDYGSGWGEFADLLNNEGYETLAFDHSDEMVALAKKKYKCLNFMFRSEFKKSIQNFGKKFDVVVSNLVLCILSQKDQDTMIKNIKKIVKDDGTIILSFCHPCFDYHAESLVSVRKSPEDAKYNQEFEYEKEIKENGMTFHDLHRPLSYYSNLFKKHDLVIVEISESEIFESNFFPDFITFVLRKNI